jgi:hypothetical protein
MKKVHLLSVLVLLALFVSSLTPTVAYASSPAPQSPGTAEYVKVTNGYLTVDNRTGGTLYVRLSGPHSYFFQTSRQGKTTFGPIQPGQYRITLRTNKCTGSKTYRMNIGGKAAMKGVVCNR